MKPPVAVRSGRRFAVLVTMTLVALGAAPGAAPGAETVAGTQRWVARYDGPTGSFDHAAAVEMSPDGSRVYVTGSSAGTRHGMDYATVAYDTSNGAELWAARYDGPRHGRDFAAAIAISPDGSRVVVTGSSAGSMTSDEDQADDYATATYDAATGTKLWVRRYNGAANSTDASRAVAVSPDGSLVLVTGSTVDAITSSDYTTVAYDADTGRRRWVSHYNGPGTGADDVAISLALSPDGSTVFVAGGSLNDAVVPHSFVQDFATVAYDAATGERLWVRHRRVGGGATALAVSPGGGAVFVTGYASHSGSFTEYDFETVAYDSATGARRWTSRYSGTGSDFEIPRSLAVSPDGSAVFVTGRRSDATSDTDYGTVAIDAVTGHRLWARRYDGPGHFRDDPATVEVSPDGAQVFVTGVSSGSANIADFYAEDYATLAYDATTGATVWRRRYNGAGDSSDRATGLAVSPLGSMVFVTGASRGLAGNDDYATVAYGTP
jgi:sugar lactone lactonase YvrE